MGIIEIKVAKLFNAFDHIIKLNTTDNVTIVIGENGIGKTVILELVEALFKANFGFLAEVPFDSLSISFSDQIWTITKEKIKPKKNSVIRNVFEGSLFEGSLFEESLFEESLFEESLFENCAGTKIIIKTDKRHGSDQEIIVDNNRKNSNRRHLGVSNMFRPIGTDRYEHRRTGEIYTSREVKRSYGIDHHTNKETKLMDWFKSKIDSTNVRLIHTQRLLQKGRNDDFVKTVNVFSEKLKNNIEKSLANSAKTSSELDRTFPTRLLKKLSNLVIDEPVNLEYEFDMLKKYRQKLDTVGLIEFGKGFEMNDYQQIGDNKIIQDVMYLYVKDSFDKFKEFEDISNKTAVLLDVINKRFKHKKLSINKDKGFVFKSTVTGAKNNDISTDKLSSGEQNELILFYELLFETNKDSLVLIDEPEISLHISWQNSFVEDLKKIAEVNNLSFIIATHSPDIINDNWNLSVKLNSLE